MIKTAFITAAGRGERLRPLTDKHPKPLMVVKGRPIIDYVMESLVPLSLEKVVINSWHLKDQIKAYVEAFREDFPFEIAISEEEELLGTGGGLKKALPLIGDAPFLMLNADSILVGSMKPFIDRALEAEASAVWWLAPQDPQQTAIGVSAGRLVKIGKLWDGGKASDFGTFSGVQVIKEIDETKLPDKGCIVKDYWIPRLNEGEIIKTDFRHLQYFIDIGTPERYNEVK
jgi:NDP-sugar pyrophosphorylase family protein